MMNTHSCLLCHAGRVQRAATTYSYEPLKRILGEVVEHPDDVETTDTYYCSQCGYEWDQQRLPDSRAGGAVGHPALVRR
jgi:hypothetical protein